MEKKEKSFLEELMPSLLFGIILLAVVLFFVMRNRAENRELQERRETEREQRRKRFPAGRYLMSIFASAVLSMGFVR